MGREGLSDVGLFSSEYYGRFTDCILPHREERTEKGALQGMGTFCQSKVSASVAILLIRWLVGNLIFRDKV